mmetsp:Transcript_32357/g.57370  ORF Transcript_32357/g.57370 Transcript_32357/m.57370 type:complete len:205 (+) Transcript_32357:173-787(+)
MLLARLLAWPMSSGSRLLGCRSLVLGIRLPPRLRILAPQPSFVRLLAPRAASTPLVDFETLLILGHDTKEPAAEACLQGLWRSRTIVAHADNRDGIVLKSLRSIRTVCAPPTQQTPGQRFGTLPSLHILLHRSATADRARPPALVSGTSSTVSPLPTPSAALPVPGFLRPHVRFVTASVREASSKGSRLRGWLHHGSRVGVTGS